MTRRELFQVITGGLRLVFIPTRAVRAVHVLDELDITAAEEYERDVRDGPLHMKWKEHALKVQYSGLDLTGFDAYKQDHENKLREWERMLFEDGRLM